MAALRLTSPQGETAKPTVFPNNTNSVAEASPQGDLGAEDLREIVEIFKQARRGLTEDSAAAILTLRYEIAVHQVLVDLLLDGKLAAEVIDENKTLTVGNFIFTPWPAEVISGPSA